MYMCVSVTVSVRARVCVYSTHTFSYGSNNEPLTNYFLNEISYPIKKLSTQEFKSENWTVGNENK
jgi:hypothetical protein